MLLITSREFSDQQAKYMDHVHNNEQVIFQRGKDKPSTLLPIMETNRYLIDPKIRKDIDEGIA